MSTRLAEFTRSLQQLGEIQVTDWDFMGLMNTDLRDLEIGSSLRKLGNTKVLEWDFQAVMPAVHRFAHQEVHLMDLVKRAAHYKVMEWDFRSVAADEPGDPPEVEAKPDRTLPTGKEKEAAIDRLLGFLQFAVVNLVDAPDRAQFRVMEPEPGVVRFRLVVAQKDVMNVIGRDGATASAIRNLLKARAAADGLYALLQILSHEEELDLSLRENAREQAKSGDRPRRGR